MKMLSEHFSAEEMACTHCGTCRMEPGFVKLLQKLRDAVTRPIQVNSGFRCAAHPVERSKPPGTFSAHTYGIAADITCPGLSLELLWRAVVQEPAFKGLGVAPWQNYIHLDTRSKTARWAYNRMGKVVYWSGKWEDLPAVTGFTTKVE